MDLIIQLHQEGKTQREIAKAGPNTNANYVLTYEII